MSSGELSEQKPMPHEKHVSYKLKHGSFRVRFIVACIAGLAALSTTSLPGWKGGLFAIFCSIITGLLTGMIGDATELF